MTKISEIQEIWVNAKLNTHDVTLSRWGKRELVQIVKRPDGKNHLIALKVIVSAYIKEKTLIFPK